ncbi:hypothetical protein ACUXK4_004551 [Methylorubrum extorquens]
MAISSTPFVGAFAWALLDAETQARIGALALELAAGQFIEDIAVMHDPARRAAAKASAKASDALLLEFLLLDERSALAVEDEEGAWLVPSAAGPLCQVCGGQARRRAEMICSDCMEPDYEDLLILMGGAQP